MHHLKTRSHKKLILTLLSIIFIGIGSVFAQVPVPGQMPPPPPSGVQTPPPPGVPGVPPTGAIPPQTPPPPPPGWGHPGFLVNPPSSEWMNQGNLNVMATGYDSQGVLQQIPLYVAYAFNGVNYNVTVLNSWNPYAQMWNTGVDIPANQTDYYLNGFTYNYYVILPSGTFYFNL